MHFVVDVCNYVRSIILLPGMMGKSFMIVLTRLNASEPKH